MSTHQDDLDLLLSLQDRVLDTPPASPSTHRSKSPDYLSDDGSPRQVRETDMSIFKDVVKDYLENEPKIESKAPKLNKLKSLNDPDAEKFSGLRLKNVLISGEELSNHFSDIRFIRLPAIRNLLVGDSVSGSWATAGVLTEKGIIKVSSTGKNYCIWKIGYLDEKTIISVFLFGDAYTKYGKEQVGSVFALLNSSVRKDSEGGGFSLTVFSAGQILKMGTSVDYGVCKGKRKDGVACTIAINKRHGVYCKYHTSNASQKYTVTRAELKGGNLKTGFRNPFQKEGIYLVDPLRGKRGFKKAQPVKVLSVDGLKKALSNAGKVTTNAHSQGIRFLEEITGKTCPNDLKRPSAPSNQQKGRTTNSLSSNTRSSSTTTTKNQPEAKRKKVEEQPKEKMIEIDLFSSDED